MATEFLRQGTASVATKLGQIAVTESEGFRSGVGELVLARDVGQEIEILGPAACGGVMEDVVEFGVDGSVDRLEDAIGVTIKRRIPVTRAVCGGCVHSISHADILRTIQSGERQPSV